MEKSHVEEQFMGSYLVPTNWPFISLILIHDTHLHIEVLSMLGKNGKGMLILLIYYLSLINKEHWSIFKKIKECDRNPQNKLYILSKIQLINPNPKTSLYYQEGWPNKSDKQTIKSAVYMSIFNYII